MIKCFTFENFKSFEKAELNIEGLTTLVGTNSSGKSNAIEGIKILSETSSGLDLGVILDGTKNTNSTVRGGSKSCPRFKTTAFKLGCLVDLDDVYDLLYEIKINVSNNKIYVDEESLYKMPNGQLQPRINKIFKTKKPTNSDGADIKVEYRNGKRGTNPDVICIRTSAILPQLAVKLPRETIEDIETADYISIILNNLKNVMVLDPVPSEMREYTRISDIELRSNCDNISSVLNQICKNKENKQKLLDIVCNLPENEVIDIEFVETKIGDVMFGLREKYINSTELVDARRLSDGTLRCIAIVTAILVSEPNSMILIEEIDNGIHPGRVEKLIDSIAEIGKIRNIDIVITTHNALLLNKYDKEKLLGVSVIYREPEKGTSKFMPCIDMEQFPKILAAGGLGNAMIDDSLILMLKNSKTNVDYSWLGV